MPAKTKKTESTKPEQKEKLTKLEIYYGVGRRKESSARIRLYPVTDSEIKIGERTIKKGDIVVNNKPIEEYFRGEIYKRYYLEPFRTTNTINRFATTIRVVGGGVSGQLGAVILGVSRALLKVDEERFRPILRKRGFLTRDSRKVQRTKAGFAHKSRARKQSPKR